MTAQMDVTPGSIFTEAMNWGINYPLEIKEMKDTTESDDAIVRRERRSLFTKIEKILYNMGYHGRHCILRALCEFSSMFMRPEESTESQLLKVFFEYSPKFLDEFESMEDIIYHDAQKKGRNLDLQGCFEEFPRCHFSLINVLLGNNNPQEIIKFL
ncbi:hypothetical protein HHI36_014722 [Cryptolaemus montrouzieri]|uniref:Uncharacterized protein n=1 Tax=Cryptolaemus montrouzieri TaxID=559131 RepID=A0ABD2N3I0_9CUCU